MGLDLEDHRRRGCLGQEIEERQQFGVAPLGPDHDHGVQLSIRDDGEGFDPKATSLGLGLRLIERRVNEFGGTLKIASDPATGTSLQIEVPFASRVMQKLGFANRGELVRFAIEEGLIEDLPPSD